MNDLIKNMTWTTAVAVTTGVGIMAGWLLIGTSYAAKEPDYVHLQPVPHDGYRAGDIAEQIAFHEGRVRRDPVGAMGWQMLGNAYLARARESDSYEYSTKAELAARRSLSLRRSRNFAAAKLLVNALLQQHRFRDALQEAENGLQIAGDDPQAHETRAETLFEVGRYRESQEELAKDDELDHDMAGLSLQARIEEVYGDAPAAIATLQNTIKLGESNSGISNAALAWFHTRVGQMAETAGRDTEAEAEYRTACELYPRNYKSWAGRARLAFSTGNWREAISLGTKSNGIAAMADVEGMIGDSFARLGNTKEADRRYAQVAVLAGMPSGVGDGMHEFAAAAAKVGVHGHRLDRQYALFCADHNRDLDGAYASCLRDLQQRQDVYAFDALAWVSLKRGQIHEAELAEKKALALGTQDSKLLFHLAEIRKVAELKAPGSRGYKQP